MTMLASHRAGFHRETAKLAILGLLLSLTFVLALIFPAGGHISVDEGVYHMMAQSFSSAGRLSVWNGYEEYPSAELTLPMLRAHGGQLFPQYPPFATVLAASSIGWRVIRAYTSSMPSRLSALSASVC